MAVLGTIVLFILIFGVIVMLHEFGHFIAARLMGVRVDEFAFGFPPRLFARKKGNTVYALNLLPLGGYVRLYGEDATESGPDSLSQKKTGPRAFIVVAGVIMNILLAWIIMTVLLVIPPSAKGNNSVIILQVAQDSVAEKAHLAPGDILLKIGDTDVHEPQDVRNFTSAHKGQEVNVVLRTRGVEKTNRVTLGSGDAPLGVSIDNFSLAQVENPPIWKAPFVALEQIWNVFKANITFIGGLIGSLLGIGAHVSTDQVSGPVGVYGLIAQFAALGWVYVLLVTAQLSLAVAVFNILPIPALDGGRLLFIIIEKIFGKKIISQQIETIVHTVGFALLMGLFLLITYQDIRKIL